MKAHLFSRYDGRRAYALNAIKEMFNPSAKIITLKKDGIIYAYLSVTCNRKAFLLVGVYNENNLLLKKFQRKKDFAKW